MGEQSECGFKDMILSIEQKRNLFVSSEYRGVGKTTAINLMCLELQAMGYEVVICSKSKLDYYASERIDIKNVDSLRGRFRRGEKAVVIVDDVKRSEMDDLIYYLHGIVPIVGYVDFY